MSGMPVVVRQMVDLRPKIIVQLHVVESVLGTAQSWIGRDAA